ncbi:MAG: hypothetical protein KAS93_05355 [Gammaproteobacteria bacterium]|nr:hypothetical protein [Gammaproteobacteria bacterium]
MRKKSQALGRSPLHKKLHALFDNVLGYLLVFAYGFIPTAPFTLRGVGNGEPLSWIMLLGGLFFALMFGLGVEMTFAFFLTYRRIEKDIGRPLRPIVK